jgi:uncharacterized protein (TIRG00374 family)
MDTDPNPESEQDPESESASAYAYRSLFWLFVAVAILGAVLWLVGFGDIREALEEATVGGYAVVVAMSGGVVITRAVAIRRLFGMLEVPMSLSRASLLYLATSFADNVTPSGQAGGIPAGALFLMRGSSASYETASAALLSFAVVANLTHLLLALPAGGLVLTRTVVLDTLLYAMVITGGLLVALVLVGIALWYVRTQVRAVAVRGLVWGASVLSRFPLVPTVEDRAIRTRVERFEDALGRLLHGSRRDIAVVVLASVGSHLFATLGLWVAFRTVGLTLPLALLFVLSPLAAATLLVPLPGGFGGYQASLTALVVAFVPGLVAGTVAAGVFVYRSVSLVLQTLAGGVVAAVVSVTG